VYVKLAAISGRDDVIRVLGEHRDDETPATVSSLA
jgi:hypothetical protein